ncbi:hypothetical protein RI367_004458 [Sorochytrium milnesiophthora]
MTLATLLPRTALRAGLRSSTPAFGTGALRRGGPGGEFYEPSGYFLGEKPLPKGQKREKDWWEDLYMYGMGGGFALIAVGLYFKPDTQITTWARKEAERRLDERGFPRQ